MGNREQWGVFIAIATILCGLAWRNFWDMMLGPESVVSTYLALAGWIIAFAVSARNVFAYEEQGEA